MSHSAHSILKVLKQHRIDFVVIGGAAAVLNGTPVVTLDLDVVHSRDAANVQRLMAALRELDARYRFRRDLSPGESHLLSAGHQLLMTEYGPLDVLGEIGEYGKGLAYEDLLARTHVEDAGGIGVRVLNLDFLIELKEQTGRDKDKAMLPTLRATLAEKKKLESAG